MKLYIDIKKMTFFEEDNIEHDIIFGMNDIEFLGHDVMLELPDNDKFIKDTLKIVYKQDENGKDTKEIDYKMFVTKEQKTWWNYPLYELKNGKIIDFDYTKYSYFANTDRRNMLAEKIKNLYNPSSEAKIFRKILKYIMDELDIKYPNFFDKYTQKIDNVIKEIPKEKK